MLAGIHSLLGVKEATRLTRLTASTTKTHSLRSGFLFLFKYTEKMLFSLAYLTYNNPNYFFISPLDKCPESYISLIPV
jgi:hypothetical protein